MRPEATEEDVQFILESIKDYLNVKVWGFALSNSLPLSLLLASMGMISITY